MFRKLVVDVGRLGFGGLGVPFGPRSEGDRPSPLAERPVELWRLELGGRGEIEEPPFEGVELEAGGFLLTLAILFSEFYGRGAAACYMDSSRHRWVKARLCSSQPFAML